MLWLGWPVRAADPTPPATYGLSIDVVTRSLELDLIDPCGDRAERLPAGRVRVIENGVERPVLELRQRTHQDRREEARGHILSRRAGTTMPTPARRFVLIALDAESLDHVAWEEVIEQLSGSAEELAHLGPVELTILDTTPHDLGTALDEPEAIRRALARARDEGRPLGRFYARRAQVAREVLEGSEAGAPFQPSELRPPASQLAERILPIARQLATDEAHQMDVAVDRLVHRLAAAPRPLVVIWAAQADTDLAGFVASLVPGEASADELAGLASLRPGKAFQYSSAWRELAGSGVSLISWTRPPDTVLLTRRPGAGPADEAPWRLRLGLQPTPLFRLAAQTTGGALVRSASQLADALSSVGGHFEVVYQSDDASAGWRQVRVDFDRPGWSVRTAPRVFVPAFDATGTRAPAPPVLRVGIDARAGPDPQGGRMLVTLRVGVDLLPFRSPHLAGPAPRFRLTLQASLPDGRPLARQIELALPTLPEQGELTYQADLAVPIGTQAFAVDVLEMRTGARGGAGPTDLPAGTLEFPLTASTPAPSTNSDTTYSETLDVRLAEARFVQPDERMPMTDEIRVRWKGIDQQLVRIAGGPRSSLELGLVLDASESVCRERVAFARSATAAARRLLGDGDRLFRVDFGETARFLGASRSGPSTLLASVPALPRERSAIFDAIGFALDRFEERSDRAALIVFTDGCETAGSGDWRSVLARARNRAVPVLVALADGRPCRRLLVTSRSGSSVGVPSRSASRLDSDSAANLVDEVHSVSRAALTELAERSGGRVLHLGEDREADELWAEAERDLDRLWVAVFAPSDPTLQPREVDVQQVDGRLLRRRE